MKRILTIVLAALVAFGGMLSTSAAQSKRTVYVASRAVPETAVEYVRDWFSNRMPVQDICDQTKLTVEQTKKVKLCPAFTVEAFERETYENYYFPLLYEDSFVGTFLVYWNKESEIYSNHLNGGADDPFIKALNSLSSSASASIMFVVTNDGYFALDSKNNVTLLQEFIPSSPKEIEKQKLAIPKMARPSRTVAIGASTAYPEQASSQPIADEEPVLTVKNEAKKLIYTSYDGGKTWRNNAKPPVHISIDKSYYPQKEQGIYYTVHNNTQNEMDTGQYFTLRKWNGFKWVSCPETDNMLFTAEALIINPKSSRELSALRGRDGISLEAGRYKLVKKLHADGQEFTCEAVFCLV